MAVIHSGRNHLQEDRDKMHRRREQLLAPVTLWGFVLLAVSLLMGLLLMMNLSWAFTGEYPAVVSGIGDVMNSLLAHVSEKEFSERWLIPLAEAILPDELSLWWFVMAIPALLCAVISIVLTLAEFLLIVLWPLIPVLPVFVKWSGLAGERSRLRDKIAVLDAGITGEALALEQAKKLLPDSCHVFTSKYIRYQHVWRETDMIVIGPGGVAIVEVKYWSGRYEGDVGDEAIFRVYGEHREQKDNPAGQVSGHAFRLSGYLREQGEDVWIIPTVLFNHPDVDVALTQEGEERSNVRILTEESSEKLYREISTGKKLSGDRVRKIVALIDAIPEKQKI